ncbi:MAG: hypothetical protein ACLU62_02535 [Hydrogeniiclostridium sp.]
MNIFETITHGISRAVGFVADKNHKAALVNRLRIVIKNERENASRAYVALGKYYLENLRDPENELTERLCRSAEDSEARIRKAFAKLDEIASESAEAGNAENCNSCEDCSDDCCQCPYSAEEITPSEFFTGAKRAHILPNWKAEA